MNKKRIQKATRKRLKLLRKVYRPYRPHFGPWLPDDHPIAIERQRAIQAQKDVITGLRDATKGGRYGGTGRPIGSKDRKPRKMRSTTGGTHA